MGNLTQNLIFFWELVMFLQKYITGTFYSFCCSLKEATDKGGTRVIE